MKFLRHRVASIAILAVSAVALAGCTPATDSTGSGDATTIQLAAATDLVSFDNGELQGGQQSIYWQPVYDTLIRRGPNGDLAPNLATEWKFEDPVTFSLTLADDLEFSDGSVLDAGAVASSMEHFRAGTGPDAAYLALIDQVEIVDATHMVFHLSAPDPGLPYKFTSTSGAVENPAQFDTPDVASMPAGSGPYILDASATVPGSTYTYVRNENYRDPEAYPYDMVVVRFLEDLTARVNALKSGQVDSAVIDGASAAEIEAAGFEVTEQIAAWEGFWIFDRDGTKVPAIGDPRVRQAINMAIDRDGIVKNLQLGYGEPTNQIFKPGTDAYLENDADLYSYDPDAARALLKDAGYADGFEIVIPHSAAFEYMEPTIQDQLAEIGIMVTYDNIPGDQYISSVLRGDYAMAPFRYTQDSTWVDITRHITPDAQLNPLHTTNTEIAGLLSDAQNAIDPADVAAADQAIAQYVLDEAWFVPIDLNVSVIGHRSDIAVQTQVGQTVLPIWNYSPKP